MIARDATTGLLELRVREEDDSLAYRTSPKELFRIELDETDLGIVTVDDEDAMSSRANTEAKRAKSVR